MNIYFIGGGILGGVLILTASWLACKLSDFLADLVIFALCGLVALVRD